MHACFCLCGVVCVCVCLCLCVASYVYWNVAELTNMIIHSHTSGGSASFILYVVGNDGSVSVVFICTLRKVIKEWEK